MKGWCLALAFFSLQPIASAVADDICRNVPYKQFLSEKQISLLEKSAQKSEYETSSAYEQRIRKLIPSLLAISVDIYDNPIATPFRYNADTQTLIVGKDSLPEHETMDSGHGRSDTATISVKYRQGGAYLGENAFGAVARVEQLHTLYFQLSWKSDGPTFSPADDVRLSADPRAAKLMRTRLKLLLVGQPLPPWLIIGEGTHTAPTISSGVEASTDAILLPIQPVCASVYDGRTRRVFASWSAAEPKL